MASQNYANHVRTVPLYHYVLGPLTLLTFIGSIVNLVKSLGNHERLYSASLIVVITVCQALLFYFCRTFPLKAQDRAIRAEENLRHYVLTGKLIDPRLGTLQVVALRFASDAEFVGLARRAAEEQLKPDAIKLAVQDWREDLYRA
jgi:hypothetical protein